MRLFFAIDLPEEIKEKLADAAEKFRTDGVTIPKKESYHITLQFLGEIEEKNLEKVKDALLSINENAFEISISGISYFTPHAVRVIFADIADGREELKSIYEKLGHALSSRGILYKNESQYTPHITLARVKYAKNKNALIQQFKQNSNLNFGKFKAKAVTLKCSRPGPEGHAHEDICKAKLS